MYIIKSLLFLLCLINLGHLIHTKEKGPHTKKVYKKVDDNNMAWEVERVELKEPQTTEIEVYNGPWILQAKSLASPAVQQPVFFLYLWHFGQLFTSIFFRLLA